jgi:hypothetical protein
MTILGSCEKVFSGERLFWALADGKSLVGNAPLDSVVEMISELLALFLPEEMQLLYRQKEMWPPPPRHVLLQLVLLS